MQNIDKWRLEEAMKFTQILKGWKATSTFIFLQSFSLRCKLFFTCNIEFTFNKREETTNAYENINIYSD